MAKRTDVTVEVLEQIRGEVVGLRGELRETRTALSDRIDQTNARIDHMSDKVDTLATRQTQTEIRLATELVAVSRAVEGVRDLLRERLDERDRIDDHERRLAALERRSA
jgi:chromosome segregation ATPase